MNTPQLYAHAIKSDAQRKQETEDLIAAKRLEQDDKLDREEWLQHPKTQEFTKFLSATKDDLFVQLLNLNASGHDVKLVTQEIATLVKVLNYARTKSYSTT